MGLSINDPVYGCVFFFLTGFNFLCPYPSSAYPSKRDKQDPITTLRWPFPEWEIVFIGNTLLWAQAASETYKVLMDRLCHLL